MKPIHAVLALTLLAVAATPAIAGPPPFNGERRPYVEVVPAVEAPLFPVHMAKGGVTNLQRFKGKVILVNIWATWCAACLHELPSLERLHRDLGGDDFHVLPVSVDEAGMPAVLAYFKKLNLSHLPALADPAGRAVEALGVREGLPWSFVIDRAGRTRGYVMGAADWNSPAARALIEFYTNEK